MAAAVRVVTERGTTALPVADVTEAADVSRQLVYIQFGDLDSLLVAAATDLVERELIPEIEVADTTHREQLLAMARHFARYRTFYRAMLTGSCAFPTARALTRLFSSLITTAELQQTFGDLDEATAQDLAAMVIGGTGAIVHEWVIEALEPLDPERLADRLLHVSTVLAPNHPDIGRTQGGHSI